MKKIFKLLMILVVISFIAPQIALASWWNPFSWKVWNIFRRPETTIINTNQSSQNNKINSQIEKEEEEAVKIKAETDRLQKEKEAQAETERLQEIKRQKELATQKAAENQYKKDQEVKALIEQQKMEQERQEATRIAVEQNALIKIEKCKIEAKKNINNFLAAGKLAVNEGMQNCIQNNMSTISQSLGGGANSPGVISSMADLARSSCQRIADTALSKLQDQSEDVYNQQYLDCLDK